MLRQYTKKKADDDMVLVHFAIDNSTAIVKKTCILTTNGGNELEKGMMCQVKERSKVFAAKIIDIGDKKTLSVVETNFVEEDECNKDDCNKDESEKVESYDKDKCDEKECNFAEPEQATSKSQSSNVTSVSDKSYEETSKVAQERKQIKFPEKAAKRKLISNDKAICTKKTKPDSPEVAHAKRYNQKKRRVSRESSKKKSISNDHATKKTKPESTKNGNRGKKKEKGNIIAITSHSIIASQDSSEPEVVDVHSCEELDNDSSIELTAPTNTCIQPSVQAVVTKELRNKANNSREDNDPTNVICLDESEARTPSVSDSDSLALQLNIDQLEERLNKTERLLASALKRIGVLENKMNCNSHLNDSLDDDSESDISLPSPVEPRSHSSNHPTTGQFQTYPSLLKTPAIPCTEKQERQPALYQPFNKELPYQPSGSGPYQPSDNGPYQPSGEDSLYQPTDGASQSLEEPSYQCTDGFFEGQSYEHSDERSYQPMQDEPLYQPYHQSPVEPYMPSPEVRYKPSPRAPSVQSQDYHKQMMSSSQRYPPNQGFVPQPHYSYSSFVNSAPGRRNIAPLQLSKVYNSRNSTPPQCFPVEGRKRQDQKSSLPSIEINKENLSPSEVILKKYPSLHKESSVSTLAVKLAQFSYFGPDILKQCTVMGCSKYPSLPIQELNDLKQEIFSLCPHYWNNKLEFESKVWNACVNSIGQLCKRLRAHN